MIKGKTAHDKCTSEVFDEIPCYSITDWINKDIATTPGQSKQAVVVDIFSGSELH